MKKIGTFSLLLLSFLMGGDGIAQLAIGQWRDHLCYKKGISIAQSQEMIWCATESGIFRLEKYNYEISRLSKISGLSDVDVNTLRYNFTNNTLLVAYKNANIDLIRDNFIYNISDIKRKLITAKKTIHNVHFRNKLAYLACGFGIVVLDMDKQEISDTYYIGINSGYINVRDITSDAANLYAATDSGVYRAALNSANLADFNSWQKIPGVPKGVYNAIAILNGKIYVNYAKHLMTGAYNQDTIYSYDGTQWSDFLKQDTSFSPVRKMEVYNNELLIAFSSNVDFFDADGAWTGKRIGAYQAGGHPIEPRQAIVDISSPDATWVADYVNGITKNHATFNFTYFLPNGPNTSSVYDMAVADGDLWVAPGSRTETWSNTYSFAEAYKFSDETWSSVTGSYGGGATIYPALDTIRDIVSIAVDPADKTHVYLGSLGVGVIEIKDGIPKVWNEKNSSLQSTGWSSSLHWLGIFGMTFDQNGNLWVSNSTAPNPLSVRKAEDGTWQSFYLSPAAPINPTAGKITINQYNQKWIIFPRGNGILVFDENGTWATSDDNKKLLVAEKGKGNLPSNEVTCLAEDRDGEIWVGTDKGIGVFYCPDQVFSSSGCDAQQILIQQDGHTQILLETEVITAIAVDGANRKWIGTQNSGVFLMSEDGTHQISHFTLDNSPLLSNEIRSIVIHPKTGEVYFGTASGIISYRNDATEGLNEFTDVYVFPNPVRPDYEGPIAITGLIENANVKITDIGGTLVYQTRALGGQAIWYGKNFKEERVRSGVYMVFCSNDDGSKTYITKILLVN